MIVGWGNGSSFPLYNNATANIRVVGRELGLLINLIRDVLFDANPKSLNIHCIGHSLGAHTCAYASNNARIRINRISGNYDGDLLFLFFINFKFVQIKKVFCLF